MCSETVVSNREVIIVPDAKGLIPWSKIQWFFGDERHVGPGDL